MNIILCIKCCSHYMNGDDYWCDFHDTYCEDIVDCDHFEEFDER